MAAMLCELCYSENVQNFHHFIPREQMREGMNPIQELNCQEVM